jgi:hypothetical protein
MNIPTNRKMNFKVARVQSSSTDINKIPFTKSRN